MSKDIAKKLVRITTSIFAVIGLIFVAVFIGMQFGVFNVKGSTIERNEYFRIENSLDSKCGPEFECTWKDTNEWNVIKEGLIKDREVIYRVSKETGISPRIIASIVVPEQLRYFTADREKFKELFEPLKILGSLSKFSLGVSGIKQETARQIEIYAESPSSPRYPGEFAYPLIKYGVLENPESTLFERLSNPTDHYYSYLYTALFIKEIDTEWKNSGVLISNNAGILSTLWNIGFRGSKPKINPKNGGAPITLSNNETFSYGDLSEMFYESDELVDVFPKNW